MLLSMFQYNQRRREKWRGLGEFLISYRHSFNYMELGTIIWVCPYCLPKEWLATVWASGFDFLPL